MLLDALQGHAVWSAVYDDAPNPLLALEQRIVSPWLGDLGSSTVMDVATGTGRWAKFAQDRGARVFGVDFCEPMLARASAVCRYVLADALQLPIRDESADLTICAFAAGYLNSLPRMVAELARITRCGGAVVVTDVHPVAIGAGWRRSFRRGGEHFEVRHREYTIEELLLAARPAGLSLERLDEPAFEEPERAVFRRAGREESFASLRRTPAILALLWRRV